MWRLACAAILLAGFAESAPVRIATYSPDLSRDGPGLLYRDLTSGGDPQIAAVVQVIAAVDPDILLLTGIDWDFDNLALDALANLLADAGVDYPHRHASRPNSGMATGIDLDGDGRRGTPDDAQGYGRFPGESGMALLSRHPISGFTDHSGFLWRDLPGNRMPEVTQDAAAIQRLSSVAHWEFRLDIRGKPLSLLCYSASPPVFGRVPERNPARNHDETAFWLERLPAAPFVLLGKSNIDPEDGDGQQEAMRALLAHVQDPRPASKGGMLAQQEGANGGHRGDPALDTASWPGENSPGNLRVDYVLPSPGLVLRDAGVFWPAPDEPLAGPAESASRHRLVWTDLDWP